MSFILDPRFRASADGATLQVVTPPVAAAGDAALLASPAFGLASPAIVLDGDLSGGVEGTGALLSADGKLITKSQLHKMEHTHAHAAAAAACRRTRRAARSSRPRASSRCSPCSSACADGCAFTSSRTSS